MEFNLDPIGNRPASDIHVKLMIHGASGTGKTAFAWSARGDGKRVIGLLMEPNGAATIRAHNPGAIVVNVEEVRQQNKASPMEVIREFIAGMLAGRFDHLNIGTVVFDSLTEVQKVMIDDQLASTTDDEGRAAVKLSTDGWQIHYPRMRRFLRTIRDLPYDVIAIALTQVAVDDENEQRYYLPMFMGTKMQPEVPSYFSGVGYTFKRPRVAETTEGGGGPANTDSRLSPEYLILWDGASRFNVKPVGGLYGAVRPHMPEVLRLIKEVGPAGLTIVNIGVPVESEPGTIPTPPPAATSAESPMDALPPEPAPRRASTPPASSARPRLSRGASTTANPGTNGSPTSEQT